MSRRERRLLRRKGKKHKSESEETSVEQTNSTTSDNLADKNIVSATTEFPKTHAVAHRPKSFKDKLLHIYDKEYKKLLIIPFAMLLIAIIIIIANVAMTGDFINKGVSLKGGISLTIATDQQIDIEEFENYLSQQLPQADIDVRVLSKTGTPVGFIVDASDVEEKELVATVETRIGSLADQEYGLEEMGSSLGESFFKETIIALLIAFLFMGLVVFFYFKNFIPSIAVILAALSDIIGTVAVTNLLGMKISTAGIAAFLMLIGYSVDTDILLSTRVLKRQEGTVFERIIGAMKTGFTMTATTMIALVVVLIFTQSETLKQIMTILLIGLVLDIINTWLQNAGILRWYVEKNPDKVKKLKSD